MGSDARPALAALGAVCLPALGGAAVVLAWQARLWATGAALMLMIVAVAAAAVARTRRAVAPTRPGPPDADAPLAVRLLLDQVPVPLVRVDALAAYALNRAARAVFGTDERIVPVPGALRDPAARRLRHETRAWRIDAVEVGGAARLIALIDIDAEERAAQDRAGDEMVDILGHEIINGLAPIVSLADSATAAAAAGDPLLPEILATLGRRVEGLEGFTRAYRTLARLPDPVPARFAVAVLVDDLARLFATRFAPGATLTVSVSGAEDAVADRDLMFQAIWALLQNGAEAAAAAVDPPGRVALAITAERDALVATVTDSGAGVPAAERARIFRPFHTAKPGGSGIGLSLARRIARAHGGDLTLDEGRTTCFRLRVPAGG